MAAASDSWKQLLSVATLGVTRAPVPAERLWPEGVSPMPAQSVASTLLRAGLTHHLWHTAGSRAVAATFEPAPPAPAPARPHVSEAAAWRLARLLNGEERELVPEWFALAEAAQRELPAHWLPTVLERLDREQRQRFRAVLGPRAAWLGELNPRWRISAAAPSEELWESGTLEERLTQLRLLRAQDPDLGRAWLTASWPSETPEARQKLLPALRIGLGPADEPFLEQALDDRRKEVRWAAAECLIHLPQSAHARRGWERLQLLITAAPGLRKLKLHIELPAVLDAAAQRDGIELKRPHMNGHRSPAAGVIVGERTWWLRQMLGRTAPQRWTERFQCSPGTFLDALERTEHGPELLPALATAAGLHPDAAWCGALFSRLWRGDKKRALLHTEELTQLLRALPAQEQEPLLLDFLASADPALVQALLTSELAWSAVATRGAFARVRKLLNTARGLALVPFALRAHLATAQQELAAIMKRLPQESPARSQLEPLAEILNFRALMTQELRGDG